MMILWISFLLAFQSSDWFQLWPEPPLLIALRASHPMTIDGHLNEEAWRTAQWSSPFVDITGDPKLLPRYETRAALLWNDTALYIGVRLEDPHVWATLRTRDTIIYYDNDVEFFFDPDGDNHRYGEIELNALNTVWDLMLEKPYRDGGPAVTAWDMQGLQHAVAIQGTLNDPTDTDRGWTAEMCIPWRDVQTMSPIPLPPASGAEWRINFSRVQWEIRDSAGMYIKRSGREGNWVWAPIGIINMHIPERWGILRFRETPLGSSERVDMREESVRRALMEAYYAQKKHRKEHGRWAAAHEELNTVVDKPLADGLMITTTGSGYEMMMRIAEQPGSYRFRGVTNDGRLFRKEE